MALAMEIRYKGGGTVRIHTDSIPQSPQEQARRKAEMDRAAWSCLEESVAKYGVEGTRERLRQSYHDRFEAEPPDGLKHEAVIRYPV